MKEDKYKYLPKFYDLETLTQEDLNKLALERNTLVKEIERLNNIINELEKDKQFYKHRFEDYIEYKSKIDKAIEWIEYYKGTKLTKEEFNSYSYWLLNILRGEDNE